MNQSKIISLIRNEIKDTHIVHSLDLQLEKDEWSSTVTDLQKIISQKKINHYDNIVAHILLCRAMSLSYMHNLSSDIIDQYEFLQNIAS